MNWAMPEEKTGTPLRTPAGFTPRTGGLASEYAREMGWGLNEPQRAKEPEAKQDADAGTNYNYGAADFGDTAKDMSEAKTPVKNEPRPPILIVKSFQRPTPKTEQNPKKKIA
jgi:hypothetical protein